jgi:hypothetical protein
MKAKREMLLSLVRANPSQKCAQGRRKDGDDEKALCHYDSSPRVAFSSGEENATAARDATMLEAL